jgi:DNA-binding CsgD family transcriptional regulator/RecA/RadA recombinase
LARKDPFTDDRRSADRALADPSAGARKRPVAGLAGDPARLAAVTADATPLARGAEHTGRRGAAGMPAGFGVPDPAGGDRGRSGAEPGLLDGGRGAGDRGRVGGGPGWRDDDLVGREAELAELMGDLRRLAGGGPGVRLMEIIGEAGIGKTALVREFARDAQDDGAVVLAGRAERTDRDVPLAALVGAFEDCGELGQLMLDHELNRSREPVGEATTAGALAAMGGLAPTQQPAAQARRWAVRTALEQLAPKTIVLIMDDLHHADPATLDLLAGLLRRPPRVGVLFVLSYRERQATITMQAAIAGRSRQVSVGRIRLAGLAEDEVCRLLAGRGSASWRRKVHSESGGNPAYLRALLAEQAASVALGDSPAGYGGVATPEYAAFLAELAGLAPEVRAVVDAAAVAGVEFDSGLVARMLDRPEPEVLRAVGELVGLDVIRPLIRGQHFAFRHPVVRRAVYSSGELSDRVRLHARADVVLRARGAGATERAWHVEQCANHGDLDAVDVLDAAAGAVGVTDPHRAASWLVTALHLAPAHEGLAARRAGLLVRLARAKGMAGYLRECRDLMHEALGLLPGRTSSEHAEAVAFTAMVQRLLGAHAETDAMLRAEIAAVDDDSRASAGLRFELAASQYRTGNSAACTHWARQALAAAQRHQDRQLEAASLALIAKVGIGDGRTEEATGQLAAATAILDGMLDAEFARCLDPVEWIGWSEIMLGRWDAALRHFRKAVDFAVRHDCRLTLPRLLLGQVFALRSRGRLTEAQAAAGHAVELARHSGIPEQLHTAYAMRLWTDVVLGEPDPEAADGLLAAAHARDSAGSWRDTLAIRLLAEARVLAGDHEGALSLAATIGDAELLPCPPYTRVAWYELLVRAELAAGRTEVAGGWAELAMTTAAELGQPGRTGLALLAVAQAALAGDPGAALAPAREAVAALGEAGLTFDALRARVVLGVALSHRGRPDEAGRELKLAQLAFDQIGAVPLARWARTERRKLAARGPHGGRDTGGANGTGELLTTRERQVAELVREGLTNRLIAKRLHISEKTVEMHLSHVFAKLNVTSRAAVAAAVAGRRPMAPTGT